MRQTVTDEELVIADDLYWKAVREGCPQCGNRVHWNGKSVWCRRCRWAKNRRLPK